MYMFQLLPICSQMFPYQIRHISISFFNFSFIISYYYKFDIALCMSRIGMPLPTFSYVISKNPYIL